MHIEEYLKVYQPVTYRTFVNSLQNKKLGHAYLISGYTGMPLKEVATYLAASLVCDNPSPLADLECKTCKRIYDGNYADLMVIDGEAGKIKKSDVENIMLNFDKTALEDKGVMIYILHLVETMTPIAVNSLLKFLEEPGKNIYAFLTTENEAKVLPTIISRTQVLRLKKVDRSIIIKEATSAGILDEDAEILSALYNDKDKIEKMAENEKYKVAKQALDDQLQSMLISKDDAIFSCQRLVIPQIKDNETARLYLKMLSAIFEDLLNLSVGSNIFIKSYDTILQELVDKFPNLEKCLLEINTSITKLDLNVSIPLLLDHVIYEITKEDN